MVDGQAVGVDGHAVEEAGLEAVELDEAGIDALEAEVDDIERALARLADGSYGTCEVCSVRLEPEVLADRPAARHCSAHLPMALA